MGLRPWRPWLTTLGLPLREYSPVRYRSSFYGQWDGETHPEQISLENLLQMLQCELPDGFAELSCHPGWIDSSFQSLSRRARDRVENSVGPSLAGVPQRTADHIPRCLNGWHRTLKCEWSYLRTVWLIIQKAAVIFGAEGLLSDRH